MRATRKKVFVVATAVIAFLVSFFTFFKHRETEMTLKQFELLKILLPWGYTAKYEAGVAIIENFGGAIVWSALLSAETGVLASLIIILHDISHKT